MENDVIGHYGNRKLKSSNSKNSLQNVLSQQNRWSLNSKISWSSLLKKHTIENIYNEIQSNKLCFLNISLPIFDNVVSSIAQKVCSITILRGCFDRIWSISKVDLESQFFSNSGHTLNFVISISIQSLQLKFEIWTNAYYEAKMKYKRVIFL